MKDFRNLLVWEKAHKLTLAIYHATKTFPREEAYGLTSQIRRSAMSIPTNIAEGCGCEGDAEFARYMRIAMASSSELEYQLLLSRDLGYFDAPSYQNLYSDMLEVRKMLNAFIQKLQAKS